LQALSKLEHLFPHDNFGRLMWTLWNSTVEVALAPSKPTQQQRYSKDALRYTLTSSALLFMAYTILTKEAAFASTTQLHLRQATMKGCNSTGQPEQPPL